MTFLVDIDMRRSPNASVTTPRIFLPKNWCFEAIKMKLSVLIVQLWTLLEIVLHVSQWFQCSASTPADKRAHNIYRRAPAYLVIVVELAIKATRSRSHTLHVNQPLEISHPRYVAHLPVFQHVFKPMSLPARNVHINWHLRRPRECPEV